MIQLGPYIPAAAPLFTFTLSIQAGDLRQHWERCNMLANYVAGYVAFQFPEREWAENLISTVTNELLEALVLLAPDASDVAFTVRQYADILELQLSHHLRSELASAYAAFLAELQGKEDDRYLEQLRHAERPDPGFNQLGLLMLAHDFHARFSAYRESSVAPIIVVVSIPTTEIAA
ncbi:MAG: hypothetical protein HC822_05305 [Oscillochloris sp.]|nr:hypothetical protein [Oscillochloris sp.]